MYEKDSELISQALTFWANYIETHDIAVSRNDVIEMEEYRKIQPLSEEQVELVLRLRKLSERVEKMGR